ncbi:hypothetical protein [Sphingobium sp. EP60837]|uniref:hypothetical protein n=1 Tax=Sphingobium sp. EP60837 TaxID=1855519 RepID=UPI0007DDD288|nr:hypothetical protein [Sphingobium sp. EP60837]ANI78160.1 hypothetical protein EP837_01748 [Sphingobium sp. EP60837]
MQRQGLFRSIRDQKHWSPGTKLLEKTADGLLLKLLSIVTPTDIEALRIAMVDRAIVVGG